MAKYKNKKVAYDGMVFDSIKECNRYKELKMFERAGVIRELRTQVKYILIPSQYLNGKCVEREVSYIADFTYFDCKECKYVVEDVKSAITRKNKDYIIKRKLMLYTHNIKINEV